MSKKPVISDQDRRRRKAMVAFQIVLYTYLIGLFLYQLHMYSNSNW